MFTLKIDAIEDQLPPGLTAKVTILDEVIALKDLLRFAAIVDRQDETGIALAKNC